MSAPQRDAQPSAGRLLVQGLSQAVGFFVGALLGRYLGLMLGCALGASVNFLISRHLARERVARWLGSHEKFRLIDDAIGREGWKIVLLLRFVPIPFGLANYCYGLTPVRFWPYLAATCLAARTCSRARWTSHRPFSIAQMCSPTTGSRG